MACGACSKKGKVRKPTMDVKLFKRSLAQISRMNDTNLSDIFNNLLLNYHIKCHMIYGSNMKNRPINKTFINSIADLHSRIVKEIKNRKMKHNTPLRKI